VWIVQHTQFLLIVEVFAVVYQAFWSAWTWHCAWLDGWFPVFWRKILLSYYRVKATDSFETLKTTYPVMPYHISEDWKPALLGAVREQFTVMCHALFCSLA